MPLARKYLFLFCAALASTTLLSQPKYRTFTQAELSEKKGKAGKVIASADCFVFKNTSPDSTYNDLHIKFNASIISVDDSGGFTTVTPGHKELDLSGRDIAPGDSVTICITSTKKAPGTKASNWYWTKNGVKETPKFTDLPAVSDSQVRVEPNGGSVLEFLYKKVVTRPQGIVVGIDDPDSAADAGWIRYTKADRKFFPHTGSAQCLYWITSGSGNKKLFLGELKNPHVKKQDNILVGELHALKLACIANDSSVTEPLDAGATLFSNLIYNDTVNGSDPLNGKTIAQIISFADSALSFNCYAGGTSTPFANLASSIQRINWSFSGPYHALSFNPLVIAGTRGLDSVYFLHPNPGATPFTRRVPHYSLADATPHEFSLKQNYPNPFNPTTTIEFDLPARAVVTLKVYNLLGQEVATLIDRELMEDGTQEAEFDASHVPSGVYFYRIVAATSPDDGSATAGGMQYTVTRKMVLLK